MTMHTLTVEFDNGVRTGTGTPVRILDHSGLESLPTAGNVIQNAMLDGGNVVSTRSDTRRLTFDLDFGDTLRWPDVARLFPSGSTCKVTATRDGVTRWAMAKRDTPLVPLGGRGVADPVAFQISLVCEDPYLKGEPVIRRTDAVQTWLEYPHYYEPTINYGNLVFDQSAVLSVNNPGDHPAGFVFEHVVAVGGDLVINVGGSELVIEDLVPDDVVMVDATRQLIRINGANGFPQLATSAPFPKLPLGDVSFLTSGTIGFSVLHFTPVYEGV